VHSGMMMMGILIKWHSSGMQTTDGRFRFNDRVCREGLDLQFYSTLPVVKQSQAITKPWGGEHFIDP
jgi:hypothetical protein